MCAALHSTSHCKGVPIGVPKRGLCSFCTRTFRSALRVKRPLYRQRMHTSVHRSALPRRSQQADPWPVLVVISRRTKVVEDCSQFYVRSCEGFRMPALHGRRHTQVGRCPKASREGTRERWAARCRRGYGDLVAAVTGLERGGCRSRLSVIAVGLVAASMAVRDSDDWGAECGVGRLITRASSWPVADRRARSGILVDTAIVVMRCRS